MPSQPDRSQMARRASRRNTPQRYARHALGNGLPRAAVRKVSSTLSVAGARSRNTKRRPVPGHDRSAGKAGDVARSRGSSNTASVARRGTSRPWLNPSSMTPISRECNALRSGRTCGKRNGDEILPRKVNRFMTRRRVRRVAQTCATPLIRRFSLPIRSRTLSRRERWHGSPPVLAGRSQWETAAFKPFSTCSPISA